MPSKSKKLLFIIFLFVQTLSAQYEPAPEIWSVPEKIQVFSDFGRPIFQISISHDGGELLYSHGYISRLTETGWSEPELIDSTIGSFYNIRYMCFSPDESQLYFSSAAYGGGWSLFCSDWDSVSGEWGYPYMLGPEVNSGGDIWVSSMPNDITLLYARNSCAYQSIWDSVNNKWGEGIRFPKPPHSFCSDWGFHLTNDFDRYYRTISTRIDTGGNDARNYDIGLQYKDTTSPTNYGRAYRLNICYYADSMYLAGEFEGYFEGFPTLTGNGKLFYFVANYDGEAAIYFSRLLVDRWGNPVSIDSKDAQEFLPGDFELLQPYPNPFNPETTVSFTLGNGSDVMLEVYDINGRLCERLCDEYREPGEHTFTFNGSKFASSVYVVSLQTKFGAQAKKMIMVK